MKILIEIPDTDIPKRQDILSVDLCFIDGQVDQCTYPFEVLKQEPTEELQEIRQEIANLVKTYLSPSHQFSYVREDEVLEIIDRYLDKIKMN